LILVNSIKEAAVVVVSLRYVVRRGVVLGKNKLAVCSPPFEERDSFLVVLSPLSFS